MRTAFRISAIAWLLAIGACGDKTETHLERFLDPESRAEATEPESLDPFSIEEDGALADRINTMRYSEVARRLGAHRVKANVRFRFSSSETAASLREESLIVLARNGDFKAKVENDGGQGYELVYSSGRLFARNRHGPFHERPNLNDEHIKWRDAAFGSWAAAYRLFRGRLSFSKLGMLRHHGRDAIRFSIGLETTAKPRIGGTPGQPPIPEGIKKYVLPIVETPSAEHRWRDKAEPRFAKGTLLVDADRGAILGVDFSGELSIPDPAGKGRVTLSVGVDMNTDGFGNPPSIEAPASEEIKPVPERIKVDTHPIDFYFGKGYTSSLGAPAGVARDKKSKD